MDGFFTIQYEREDVAYAATLRAAQVAMIQLADDGYEDDGLSIDSPRGEQLCLMGRDPWGAPMVQGGDTCRPWKSYNAYTV